MILWEGPSRIDGTPIVVIATIDSKNTKTGAMVQTWILRQDVAPNDAVKSGADVSVCGHCQHRGTSCYVRVWQAPTAVWKKYNRGGYKHADPKCVGTLANVRIGAYGDPMAVPVEVWEELTADANGWTGYTHQWASCRTSLTEDRKYQRYCMASADTPEEAECAQALGWRTFRVKLESEPRLLGEASCPASKEQGHKLGCHQCLACCGTTGGRKGSVVINVHGPTKKQYVELRGAS